MLPIFAALAAALAFAAPAAQAEQIIGLTNTDALFSFDSTNPLVISTPVPVTGLQPSETILGIDYRPATGQLYGLGSTSRLYVLDTNTGAATQVGSAGAFTLSGTSFGFDFNPSVDRIRVVSNINQNLRLNPNDGTLTAADAALTPASAQAAAPTVSGAAYTNNLPGASPTTLYVIDYTNDQLMLQGGINGSPSPNGGVLTSVGSLGIDATSEIGFDISGATGVAYASITPQILSFVRPNLGGVITTGLYTVDLNTGAVTSVGDIGGLLVNDISVVPTPEPASLALLAGAAPLLLARRRKH
jgi:hypothetical protein